MARLGFLGLGMMGYPMARNLLRAGHSVALWSHSGEKARRLAGDEGGQPCATPAEVAAASECVFICVGDAAMVGETALGAAGLAEGASPSLVVADASTIGPSQSRAIATEFHARTGATWLDTPCTGSTPGAEGGTLTFMIGGDEAAFTRVKPWFEPMGKRLFYCGGPGLGLQAKLTQNLILSNLLVAFSEGMVLATKGGVDPDLMLEILDASAAKSGLISYKAPFMLNRNFDANFSTKWMSKDVGLMLKSGEDLGVPLFLTATTHQVFQTALAEGLAENDMCSIINVLEGMSGITVESHKKSTKNY
jgi:3-hydroxyisobutyrate dehydrogenase-like beta-hydroxyacid dehydrogenase